jgi:hypothetical protein
MGFTDTIVLLTGVHFHFAGLAFPVIAGEISNWASRRIVPALAICAIAAVPLVATGITVFQVFGQREVEFAAAWFLAIVGFGLGLVQIQIANSQPPLARLILSISGVCLAFALLWSLAYAGGQLELWPPIEIPVMARWHGMVNAFGASFLGMVGWNLCGARDEIVAARRRAQSSGLDTSRFLSKHGALSSGQP